MQGVPVLAQDAVLAGSSARFVGVLACLRARLAPLLAPPKFTSTRQITWHGASAGESSLQLQCACRCPSCCLHAILDSSDVFV